MSWMPMKGSKKANQTADGPPGERGRYLIRIGAPWVEGQPRWVHFSYRGDSFRIRDYLGSREMRQDLEQGLTAATVWRAAIEKIPATGEYFHPADDIDWWVEAIGKIQDKP